MNLLLMVVMMGVAMVFFHGQGHHKPAPAPELREKSPDGAKVPSTENAGSARPSTEPIREKAPSPTEIHGPEPRSPTPQAD